MAFFTIGMPWNEGEEKMHRLLQTPQQDNPTATRLTPQAIYLLQRAPLLAIATLDSQDRPWTSLWGGSSGFSEPLDEALGLVGTRTIVDFDYDPVVEALAGGTEVGKIAKTDQKMFSGLTIDLMTRKRVKISGRVLVVSIEAPKVELVGDLSSLEQPPKKQIQIQVVSKIEQSLGNCPKYLNQWDIRPTVVWSKRVVKAASLSQEARAVISGADMFFLSSATTEDMDTNHRGGPPGFVRIMSDTEIVYPEYSGNRLYQSLGNLQLNPKIGITFPDYTTGDVVYITGTAQILVLDDAAGILPGSNLAVKITIDEQRFVEAGLPFRGTRKTPSPYNPLVRALSSEGNVKSSFTGKQTTSTLLERVSITPTVARFKFSVPEGISYTPGQWVALDFSKELNMGYSHMRDDDPTSLNDDFVRTFTISSAPGSKDGAEKDFEITIRKVGVVTDFLFRADYALALRIPVLGVGGDFSIQGDGDKDIGYIAAGVGITPLLGQLDSLPQTTLQHLRLHWTIRAADIDLVVDTLDRHPVLRDKTLLYVTAGSGDGNGGGRAKIDALTEHGVAALGRRMTEADVSGLGYQKWYLCAAKPLRAQVLGWLRGEDVVFEDFDY